MLQEKVSDLILSSIEAGTDEQKEILRGVIKSAFTLATASDNYTDRSVANEGDDDAETKVSEALVDLAQIVDISSAEKIDRLKAVIKDVYTDPDAVLEQAGEELFAAAVDFRLAASTLADLFPAPPVEEV